MSGPHRTPYAILVGWWGEGGKRFVVKMLLHVHAFVSVCARVVACVHMSMYDICTCVICVRTCVHVSVHVCECVCMHTCMCIYVIRMYIKVRYSSFHYLCNSKPEPVKTTASVIGLIQEVHAYCSSAQEHQ